MNVLWFEDLSKDDVGIVGGKGANLGEMVNAEMPVPPGFVVTSEAYSRFLKETDIYSEIMAILNKTDVNNSSGLQKASAELRKLINTAETPESIKKDILENYKKLSDSGGDALVAVRSSATAEDLPTASFAGQQDTFLNIEGNEALLERVKDCWSSLFTPRAIFYRAHQGFDHSKVLIAVVVQEMVNAEKSGVMFTVHPATGEEDKVVIEAGWGLGEGIVSGTVTPDHYVVNKSNSDLLDSEITRKDVMFVRDKKSGDTVQKKTPEKLATAQVLTGKEIKDVAVLGKLIEDHYNFPQDIEWAIEGKNTYLLQSRPITVLYKEEEEEKEVMTSKEIILKGLGSSPGIGSGKVRILSSVEELDKVQEGDILVTVMTNPDMVPAMKRANAIVTEEGGMTCHAAIVSRELGIPCIVGTGKATKVLKEDEGITVDGTKGMIYRGIIKEKKEAGEKVAVAAPTKLITGTEVKVNLAVPDERIATRMAQLADGVGLLRVEHIILGFGEHPLNFIRTNREEEFIDRLTDQLRVVVDPFFKKGGIVYIRTLDAPTDEFRGMKGGEDEPLEHNPMLGWRGIRRGLDQPELLRAEFRAIKKLVDEGHTNIGVMVPLVQRKDELVMAKEIALEVGLVPHKDVQFGIMVETPAAALTIDEFIEVGLDFISFGTNDLTQYTLAIDRNNERVQKIFSEKHPAVIELIKYVIKKCNAAGVDTSICGQAGSYPDVVEILVKLGITSVSANPDAVEKVRETVMRTEKKLLLRKARAE